MMDGTILNAGIKAQGRNEYKRLLEGGRLTRGEQIKAKCYECCGGYADGAGDCGVSACPIYPSHPYNPNLQKHGK